MQQNTNKIVSSPIVREAIFAWYMEDAKKAIEDAKKTPEDLEKAAEASKKQKVFSSVPEQIFGRFANVYIKPFIDTSYDDDYQGILKEFSQQLMVELTAIGIPKADPSRKDNALFVADIEAYLNSGDKTKTKTLSLALWRAARKILMEKGDERLKSDAPIKPIELNKFEPVTYELLVYSLQKDIHKSVKEDLDNLIDQMIDEPNQSAKELEQKIQHSLKSALRQAMTSAGVKNHINVLQSKSNISFEFLLKRDEKGYQNPKNAVLKKAREAFNKSAQELHNKHRLFINQGDNPENPLLYPPSIDNLEPFFTGTLPVDDALMDQLVSKIWDALLAYYRAKYNLFEDIPHADKEERELVLTAVKDHNMNLSQVFSGTSSPVLHQYLGDEPDFNKTPVLGYMKRILALWVLSKKPKPAQP